MSKFREKRKQSKSIDEAKRQCKQLLENLDKCENFNTAEVFKYLSSWVLLPMESFCPRTGSPEALLTEHAYCTPAYALHCQSLGTFLAETNYAQLFIKISGALQDHIFSAREDPQGFDNFRLLCHGIVNYTDQSAELCKKLAEYGAINNLIQALTALENRLSSRPYVMIPMESINSTRSSILLILYNLRHDNVPAYRKANASDVLQQYVLSESLTIKTLAVLVLAHIGNEKERELLKSRDSVSFLVALLKQAIQSEHHSAILKDQDTDEADEMSLSIVYLLDGINDLAINDDNKVELNDHGVTAILTFILQSDYTDEEKRLATKVLWCLAFAESVRNNAEVQGLKPALYTQQRSKSATLREASNYALWEIEADRHALQATGPNQPYDSQPPSYEEVTKIKQQTQKNIGQSYGHVMLSYQWKSQKYVKIIREWLVQKGFDVWMDIDKMKGDILATMADAVENSRVVLICMSEKYKNSCSCRTEATYAYKLKKHIIPLLVEDGYDPDGWLGALVGMKMYYRFCTEDEVSTNMQALVEALGESGKTTKDNANGKGLATASSPAHQIQPPTNPIVNKWTITQVQAWLAEKGLTELCSTLDFCDGEHLAQMYIQYRQTPDVFRSDMKEDFQLTYRSYLKFTTALEKLFKNT